MTATQTKQANSTGEMLSNAQAAEVLGVTPGTLNTWRSEGRYPIPYVKVGTKLVRYRRADLLAWIESQVVRVGTDPE